MLTVFLSDCLKITFCIYSYSEKGCRKRARDIARDNPGKVLWVVLSALFFKEILKNGTGGHGHVFANTKGKVGLFGTVY